MARIRLRNVDVTLPIYGEHNMNLKSRLVQVVTGRRPEIEAIEALRTITLNADDGQRIGIVGPNGAGKTTLLRVAAGILPPTRGTVEIDGSVVALLSSSLGLDPQFTGYENIIRRGVYINQTPAQMDSKVDEIAAFSGLSDRLRHPVRTYSAGMVARLSFSIATVAEPDILVIDEGIGMADSEFAERATLRFRELIDRSRILLIASHNEQFLAGICNRFVRLDASYLVEG
ncbi:MAG: ATP-binding cassette domain-containing protein [Actinomycetota bacterium]